jgi:hypothetical protein
MPRTAAIVVHQLRTDRTLSAFSLSTILTRVGTRSELGDSGIIFLTRPYLPDHRLRSWPA